MIHSASTQSRPAVIVAWIWSFGTDEQTDTLCENSDRPLPAGPVGGLVYQLNKMLKQVS